MEASENIRLTILAEDGMGRVGVTAITSKLRYQFPRMARGRRLAWFQKVSENTQNVSENFKFRNVSEYFKKFHRKEWASALDGSENPVVEHKGNV